MPTILLKEKHKHETHCNFFSLVFHDVLIDFLGVQVHQNPISRQGDSAYVSVMLEFTLASADSYQLDKLVYC